MLRPFTFSSVPPLWLCGHLAPHAKELPQIHLLLSAQRTLSGHLLYCSPPTTGWTVSPTIHIRSLKLVYLRTRPALEKGSWWKWGQQVTRVRIKSGRVEIRMPTGRTLLDTKAENHPAHTWPWTSGLLNCETCVAEAPSKPTHHCGFTCAHQTPVLPNPSSDPCQRRGTDNIKSPNCREVRTRTAHLHYPAEVTVGGQLQALLFCPGFHVSQLLADDRPPVVRAQSWLGVGHQPVEEPHVDEVEELGEELDGQGGVDSAAPQQRHGSRERVQNIICAGTWTKARVLSKRWTRKMVVTIRMPPQSLLRH